MNKAMIFSGAFAALVALGGGAYAAPTHEQQVDRLVSMGSALLGQRQPVPKIRVPGPRTPAQGYVQLAQAGDPRVTQLEEQVRQLNGLVEELNFQVLQMQDQLRRMQEDNEFRFQELEKGGAQPATQKSDNTNVEEIIENTDGTTETASGAATPPRTLGSVTFDKDGNVVSSQVDDSGLPGVETGVGGTDGTQVAALPATSDPDELYRSAYEFVLSGDYDAAEAGFRRHVEEFPNDTRTADARFWLGEALLGQQKYREAAQVFLGANRDYPEARKAPEMMLKLGISLAAMDQNDVACATLSEVGNRYPQASTAVLERVKVEQARASC
jgi:tol-pal system protein YbgF